jgi:ribosomal protein S18 acetylase RimI-like enzyme
MVQPRRARADEARAVADVWLRSRYASIPAIPAPVHSDNSIREWYAREVLPNREVWVVEGDESVVAMMVLKDEWLDALYVDPTRTGQGIGSLLVDLAKERRPDGIDLWAFQSNVRALRFYERHGFVEIESTDGDNEEGAPDVHYRWTGGSRV